MEKNQDHYGLVLVNAPKIRFIYISRRLLDPLLLFAHSILYYENSSPKLKEMIKLPDKSTYYTGMDQFNFRQGVRAKNIIPLTKYEHRIFTFFRELFQTSST